MNLQDIKSQVFLNHNKPRNVSSYDLSGIKLSQEDLAVEKLKSENFDNMAVYEKAGLLENLDRYEKLSLSYIYTKHLDLLFPELSVLEEKCFNFLASFFINSCH